jgi:hypothetical protein
VRHWCSGQTAPKYIRKRYTKRMAKCGPGDAFRRERISAADFQAEMVD